MGVVKSLLKASAELLQGAHIHNGCLNFVEAQIILFNLIIMFCKDSWNSSAHNQIDYVTYIYAKVNMGFQGILLYI